MVQFSPLTNRILGILRLDFSRDSDEKFNALILQIYKNLTSKNIIESDKKLLEYVGLNLNKETLDSRVESILEEVTLEEIKTLINELTENFYLINRFESYSNKGLAKFLFQTIYSNCKGDFFDIGCGRGFFLLNALTLNFKLGVKNKYFGMDINAGDLAIAKMILNILGCDDCQLFRGDILDPIDKKFDFAFTYPPVGFKRKFFSDKKYINYFGEEFAGNSSGEWLFVDRMLSSLKENGKGVALVFPRTLYNTSDKQYKEKLISSGMLEAIIELPAGLINNVNTKMCLLFFSSCNDKVKFIDASNVLKEKPIQYMNIDFPVDEMINLLNEADGIPIGQLNEFTTLMPSSVLLSKSIKHIKGHQLSSLAEVFNGCQYTLRHFEPMFTNAETKMRILTSSDIIDGKVDWCNLQKVKLDDKRFLKYSLRKNDLVVTSKSSKVKICLVDEKLGEEIIVTGGMIIIRPDLEKVNPVFLKLFLESEIGQIELKTIQRGSIIITFTAKDLLKIIIPEVSIEKQELLEKKYKSKYSSYLALKSELERVEVSLNNLYSDVIDGE